MLNLFLAASYMCTKHSGYSQPLPLLSLSHLCLLSIPHKATLLYSCPLVSFCEPPSLTRTICLTMCLELPSGACWAHLSYTTEDNDCSSPRTRSKVQLREAGLCECLPSSCLTDDPPFLVLAQCRQPQQLCFRGCNDCHAKEPAFPSPALSHCQSIGQRGRSLSTLSIPSLSSLFFVLSWGLNSGLHIC